MIPERIKYSMDDFREILLERKGDDLYSLTTVDNFGGRCIITMSGREILELADNISLLVYGDGRDD
jgi:hypothetical protein